MSALVERLAALLDEEAFHATPLLEPTDRFFPDRWTGDPESAGRVLARLAGYAGITRDIEVTVGDWDGVAAVLVEVRDDAVSLEVPARIDRRSGDLFTCLAAREIVRARRMAMQVAGERTDAEEIAIDLEGLAIGFGVLTTNGASMHRAYFEGVDGYSSRSKRVDTEAVATSAIELAAGLAAFVVAQGRDERERKRIARYLEPSQREAFDAACEKRDTVTALGVRAPLPDDEDARDRTVERWLRAGERSVERLRLDDVRDENRPVDGSPDTGLPRGQRIAFRVHPNVGGALLSLSSLSAAGAGLFATVIGTHSWPLAALGAACAAGVAALWKLAKRPLCSNPECEHPVDRVTPSCSKCGSALVGTISHRDQRLAAEEDYLAERKRAQGGYRDRA